MSSLRPRALPSISIFRLSGVPSKAYEFDDSQRAGGSQSFFFTPCVDSPKTCSVGGAPEQGSIVQFDNSDPSNLLCLGIIMHWADPTDGTGGDFALVDPTDPTAGFTGYWANGDSSPGCATASGQREITITFTCQASGPASFSSVVESPACSYTANFASCGACPEGCGSAPSPFSPIPGPAGAGGGMSFGGIFLVLIAVLAPLYVVGGCAYNHKQKGTSLGFDSMPNAGFWRDLPSLVKEGGGFAISKVTGKGGGGGGTTSKIPDAEYASMGDDKAENPYAAAGGYGATSDTI